VTAVQVGHRLEVAGDGIRRISEQLPVLVEIGDTSEANDWTVRNEPVSHLMVAVNIEPFPDAGPLSHGDKATDTRAWYKRGLALVTCSRRSAYVSLARSRSPSWIARQFSMMRSSVPGEATLVSESGAKANPSTTASRIAVLS